MNPHPPSATLGTRLTKWRFSMYDRNERATNIATSATMGSLLAMLTQKGVLTRSEVFTLLYDAAKGLKPFSDQPDVQAACDQLAAIGREFSEHGG